MKGYIYSIINTVDGKRYVGQTVNITRRLGDHFRQLKAHKHPNYLLQKAWDTYGEDNFITKYDEFEINEAADLNQKEIDAIKYYNSFADGYNLTPAVNLL